MAAEIFRFGDFELDRGAYELRRGGTAVHLQRIPFQLLSLLVERRGQLVTREEILEYIWGKGVFVDSENAIRTAVRKIRRALNDDADAPRFIFTVSARGYRFAAPISLPPLTPRARVCHAPSPPLPLPDKPSIAVLPFTNMSGDREQEYFSDGVTDDLITELSRLSTLFVIARTSTFTYKGKAVTVQEVSRELGVRYVLEGSVRKAGGQVRITSQLVDATTGYHLWAERYDRPMRDIFAVQDEIVRRIVTTLNLQLTLWGKRGVLVHRRTDNLDAYDDFLRGLRYSLSHTREGSFKAQRMFEKAVALDPNYAHACAALGYRYLLHWVRQWSQDPHAPNRALHLAQQAVALDDFLSFAHIVLGESYLWKRQYDQAIAEAERAIVLDPNSALGYGALAEIMDFSGQPAEAIGLAKKAMRLDPRNQDFYLFYEGWAYRQMGRHEEAILILKRYNARYPTNLAAHLILVVDFTELGRDDEARAEAAEVLRISPQFSLDALMQRNPMKDETVARCTYADLRKAGLK